MNKTVILSWVLATTLLSVNVFAADTNANSSDNSKQPQEIDTTYSVQNETWTLILNKDYSFSIDNYIVIKFKDDAVGKIKNLEFAMDKKAKDIAYVCMADQDISDISFEKYMERVNKLTDETKKEKCEKEFAYAVTGVMGNINTFDFKKGDKFLTVTLADNKYTDIPFSDLEVKSSDDNSTITKFNIKKETKIKEEPTKQAAPVKKEEPKPEVVNTKKTGLATNILLFLLAIIMISVIKLKNKIEA